MDQLKIQSHKVGQTSYWLASLSSMSTFPPIPGICFFQNLTMKIQGQGYSSRSHSGSNILSIHIPCCSMLTLPFLKYSFFKIWPRKFKVRVMGEGKVQSHKVCPTSYWYTSLSFSVWNSVKKVACPLALNLKAWELSIFAIIIPLKSASPLLSLNSHSPHQFFLPFIFSLCQVSSIFMLCHLWSSFSAIRPQPCHPSCRCVIHPTPSVLHRPSVAPSLQPPAPSVRSPRHPPAASSLWPSGDSWMKFDLKWVEFH